MSQVSGVTGPGVMDRRMEMPGRCGASRRKEVPGGGDGRNASRRRPMPGGGDASCSRSIFQAWVQMCRGTCAIHMLTRKEILR
eukprot:4033660-Heterocapsa_arctica.AAC.1